MIFAHAMSLLAQTAPTNELPPLLVRPLPVWDYWYLLLIPLCLGVSIVYKSIKCQTMDRVPREATLIFMWILVGMIAAAGVLAALVGIVGR